MDSTTRDWTEAPREDPDNSGAYYRVIAVNDGWGSPASDIIGPIWLNPILETAKTYTGRGKQLFQFDPLIEVNPNANPAVNIHIEWRGASGTGQYNLIGFKSYDADRRIITSEHVSRTPGSSLATLAQPLKVGDTKAYLNTTAGWQNGAGNGYNTLAVWPYTGDNGQVHPRSAGYTRNLAQYPAGGISGNTITLSRPFSIKNPNTPDGSWPTGTEVANHSVGGTFNYLTGGYINDSTWHTATFNLGYWQPGAVPSSMPEALRPGTKYIRPLILHDWNGEASSTATTEFRNFSYTANR